MECKEIFGIALNFIFTASCLYVLLILAYAECKTEQWQYGRKVTGGVGQNSDAVPLSKVSIALYLAR